MCFKCRYIILLDRHEKLEPNENWREGFGSTDLDIVCQLRPVRFLRYLETAGCEASFGISTPIYIPIPSRSAIGSWEESLTFFSFSLFLIFSCLHITLFFMWNKVYDYIYNAITLFIYRLSGIKAVFVCGYYSF